MPFRESGESSAIEFLANGEGAFHFQDLRRMPPAKVWT